MSGDDDDFGLMGEQDADESEQRIGMVVPARAASSAELEAEEADYIARMSDPALLDHNPSWPLPMIGDDGQAMLSKEDLAELRDFFGVSEAEYRALYEQKDGQL